jgi:RHS repeat-associated protein
MNNQTLTRKIISTTLTLCIILMSAIAVFAQEDTPTTNSATSAGGGIDTGAGAKENFPSLYNGKLNWKLPLMSIGGRGAIGFTPMLQVQDGDWKVETDFDDDGGQGSPHFIERLSYENSNVTGLGNTQVGYGPGVVVFKADKYNLYRYGAINNSGLTLTRVYFYGAGGGRTEFVDALYKGKPFQLSHAGYRSGHFVSRDGSGMEFISDTTVRDTHTTQTNPVVLEFSQGSPSGYLRSADGTTYRVDNSTISWIRDRNGNTIHFTYESVNNQITSATDSNGRTINFEYGVQDASGTYDKLNYKGFGGSTKSVRIYRKTLSEVLPVGTPHNLSDLFPDFSSEGQCWGSPQHPNCVERDPDANGGFDPSRVSSVVYPDGRGYQFKYNPYGELAKVEMATGSAIEYKYAGVGSDTGLNIRDPWVNVSPDPDYPSPFHGNTYVHRRLSEVLVYREGNVLENKQTIDIQKDNGNTIATSEVFDGQTSAKLSSSKQYFYGYSDPGVYYQQNIYPTTFWYPSWRDGREYKTEALSPSTGEVLKRSETDQQAGGSLVWSDGGVLDTNPHVVESRSFDVPSNLQTKTTYSYDQFNNVTDTFEYDFGVGQAGQFLRRSHTDFVDLGEYLRRIPTQSWVSSDIAGGNKVSLIQYEYDNYSTYPLVDRYNVVGHDTANYGTSKTIRGNVTKTTTYTDAQNQIGEITSKTQYDILGNVVKTIDAKGNASTIDYADRFGSPDGEARSNSAPSQLNGKYTFAFATSSANTLGWVSGYSQVDYWTGLSVNTEDMNGVISKSLYNDPLDRQTQTFSAVGTTKEIQSNIIYDDANRRIERKSDLYQLNDNLVKSETFYDSLGRTFETRRYENGIYIKVNTIFDALGRTKKVSSPHSPMRNEQPAWSEIFYDDLGRVIKENRADNTETYTEFSGNNTTVIDQAGKKQRTVVNAIGKITRVDEPNSQGQLGTITNPTQPTNYSYDTSGNLVKVTQGGQSRYFLYNSVGQLIRVRQPEQNTNPSLTKPDPITGNSEWSIGSTYDLNGAILTSTDAKGITNTNTYDVLSRVLSTSYNDNTPTVTNEFDNPIIPLSKGRLTKTSNGISATEYTSFNLLGQTLTHKQTTDSQIYTTSYKYTVNGTLLEETYPSGRVAKTTYDSNGGLSTVESKKNSQSPFRIYANSFAYNSAGTLDSMRLGNGLYETAKYNNRSQITQLSVGRSVTNTDALKISYDYGTTQNNGNILKQTIQYQGLANPYIQNYQYDSLNRLVEAKETSNNQQTWKQNFDFDRYGNRTGFIQTVGLLTTNTTPSIDTATNRFSTGQGYVYDLSGNLIQDNQGRQVVFDGNNKQIEIKDSSNNIVGRYYYDGNGRRVKKVTAEETVIFVYDTSSKLVAEYSTKPIQSPKINYLTRDHLGTPRLITDQNGQVVSRRDYMPFGESITASRTTNYKYGVQDNVRQGFTGYQKDSESGLDFAEARMYSSNHGRFTAIDPLLASGKSANPQTFNRYAYVVNRPLTYSDASGMEPCCSPEELRGIIRDAISGKWTFDDRSEFTVVLDKASIEKIVEIILPAATKQFDLSFNAQNSLNSQQTGKTNQGTSAAVVVAPGIETKTSSTALSQGLSATQGAEVGGTASVNGDKEVNAKASSSVTGTLLGTLTGTNTTTTAGIPGSIATVTTTPGSPQTLDQTARDYKGTASYSLASVLNKNQTLGLAGMATSAPAVGPPVSYQTSLVLSDAAPTISAILQSVSEQARAEANRLNPVVVTPIATPPLPTPTSVVPPSPDLDPG